MKIKMRIVRAADEPTRDMIKFFEDRTQRHIDRVCQNMYILPHLFGFLREDEARRRGKEHDSSKFEAENYDPYVWLTWWHNHGKNDKVYPEGMKEKTYQATGRHVHKEDHHPEYWSNIRDMTPEAMAEMVSDWVAMSQELGDDIYGWIEKNIGKWDFSAQQLDMIYSMVDALIKHWEEAKDNAR